MDATDFEFIETHLNVALPRVFCEFMRAYPNDPTHELQNGYAVLQTNAEAFVIEQLWRFNNDRGVDYYEAQSNLRGKRFIDIGDDGCGNFYCMEGNNSRTNDLWLWEHDPPNGFIKQDTFFVQRDLGSQEVPASLQNYFGKQWVLATRDNPLAVEHASDRFASRANHPYRSILQPITMPEWRKYVESDRELQWDEFIEVPNPFTNEKLTVRRWPGRAKFTIGDQRASIENSRGCLTLKTETPARPEFESKFRKIAQALNANVF